MGGGDIATSGGAIGYTLWLATEIAFKWIPGAVSTTLDPSMDPFGVQNTTVTASDPITSAVTTGDIANFLQAASAPAPGIHDAIFNAWGNFVAVSLAFSLLFGAWVIYNCTRILQVRRLERMKFEAAGHTIASRDVPRTTLRWHRVLNQALSNDEQLWRLAILEADNMLGELLDVLGYKGETIAEKMRQADRGYFNTIDLAWEAHRMRNRIVKEGTAVQLTHAEVRRTMRMYEKVFREFRFLE